ncbi:hypothetical protein B0H63DRAFT_527391 [Podospora didyma]|uniref:SET domain-containing protein n=1 Tax=Podospora didyma TaxID=330526 RepID=A0AAE0KAY1_9PEZI|nr:hypothetical protein B0H63DRAFT_527391 [Podospora didyma]
MLSRPRPRRVSFGDSARASTSPVGSDQTSTLVGSNGQTGTSAEGSDQTSTSPAGGGQAATLVGSDGQTNTSAEDKDCAGNVSTQVSSSAEDKNFDASKTGKIPVEALLTPPLDKPAVKLGLVSPRIGYGLYAARNIKMNEVIFTERPFISALWNETGSTESSLLSTQWRSCRTALRNHPRVFAALFPTLAGKSGTPLISFAEARPIFNEEIGRYLSGGRFDECVVTEEEYNIYTRSAEFIPLPRKSALKKACHDFFKAYAFEDQKEATSHAGRVAFGNGRGQTTDAHIYLLGGMINHCCRPSPEHRYIHEEEFVGPNCECQIGRRPLTPFVKDNHLAVKATRDIAEGEELTWDYSKESLDFACICPRCENFLSRCRIL